LFYSDHGLPAEARRAKAGQQLFYRYWPEIPS
jgi:hypothetical protein